MKHCQMMRGYYLWTPVGHSREPVVRRELNLQAADGRATGGHEVREGRAVWRAQATAAAPQASDDQGHLAQRRTVADLMGRVCMIHETGKGSEVAEEVAEWRGGCRVGVFCGDLGGPGEFGPRASLSVLASERVAGV